MAYQQINRGTTANDGTGDDARTWAGKTNDNFNQVEADLDLKTDKTYAEANYIKAGDLYLGNQLINETHSDSSTTYATTVIWVKWSEGGTVKENTFNEVITLTAPDGTYNRLDRIVLNINSYTVYKKDGTAGPVLTPAALAAGEIHLYYALVETGTSAPSYITEFLVYDENAQEVGGEYDTLISGAGIASNAVAGPKNGTYHIAFTSAGIGQYIEFSHTTPIATPLGTLELFFKLPATQFFSFSITGSDGTNTYTLANNIQDGSYGLSRSITTWQHLTIPLNPAFNISKIRITNNRNNGNYYFDEINLKLNTQQGTTGSAVAPIPITYPDLAALVADQPNQLTNYLYQVENASGFSTITTGRAWVKYKGEVTATETDYIIQSKEEAGVDIEGTAVLSTGEVGGTKFLREDGDGTCSWQDVSGESITASNGLTRTADDIALGGTLSTNKTINTGGFTLSVQNTTNTSSALTVYNTQGGIPLSVTASGGLASSIQSQGSNSYAFFGFNVSDSDTYPVIGTLKTNNNTNTADTVLSLGKNTYGTPANGMGSSLEYKIQTSTTSSQYAGSLDILWSDVTHATRTSQFKVDLVNSASQQSVLTIDGNGSTQLNQYGSGTITGTPAYALQVDSSGNVIEGALGGGSSFGLENQIPVTNAATNDFDYDANFTYDSANTVLKIGGASTYIKASVTAGEPAISVYDAGTSHYIRVESSDGASGELSASIYPDSVGCLDQGVGSIGMAVGGSKPNISIYNNGADDVLYLESADITTIAKTQTFQDREGTIALNKEVETTTNSTYNIWEGNANNILLLNAAGACSVIIPSNASVPFPIGTEITLINYSTATATVSITTDYIYTALAGLTLVENEKRTLIKVAATNWILGY